jgi:hypothetical protein
MLVKHTARDELGGQRDSGRDDQEVVEVSEDGDEVRNEVNRTESVGNN